MARIYLISVLLAACLLGCAGEQVAQQPAARRVTGEKFLEIRPASTDPGPDLYPMTASDTSDLVYVGPSILATNADVVFAVVARVTATPTAASPQGGASRSLERPNVRIKVTGDAGTVVDPKDIATTGKCQVAIQLSSDAFKSMLQYCADHNIKRLGILIDGSLFSAPILENVVMQDGITLGREMTGPSASALAQRLGGT